MKLDIISVMEKLARKKPVKVVVCEGWDERCLRAAESIAKNKLAEIILLGDLNLIKEKVKEFNLDIGKTEIIDFKNSELKEELAEKLTELRKHKGMTIEEARKLVQNENYFGCMYVYCGYADALVGSAICPTGELMRPALQILRKKDALVSEVSILNDVKNDRILFGSDFSLNIEPNAEELAQIALNAAECARDFTLDPKVALLSFSTKGSGGEHPSIQVVKDAVRIAKEKDKSILIDGELQVDAAVSKFGAERKCPDSPLKGDANTLIFPNLTASNIFAHGIMQFSDMKLEFAILKGLVKPVGILGRSVPVSVIRNMIVSCAMLVNAKSDGN